MVRIDKIQLGNAVVTRILEWRFELGTALFPDTPSACWRDNSDLLVPDFWSPDTDQWRITIQSWYIEVDGQKIVVDTGAGNDRQRPQLPPLDHLSTGFLDTLENAGVDRNEVDVVINTHIHSDHVGWNTMLVNGAWSPTFPNARYLMPAPDYQHFRPDGAAAKQTPRSEVEQVRLEGARLVFLDSVIPVDTTGQIVLWSDDYQVSGSLRLRPAPGHTPGSSVLWLDAGKPALFVGDVTHSPIQLRRPDDYCAFDMDPAAAALTRRQILAEAAAAGAVVIPAHYPGRSGATIQVANGGFDIDEWLQIDRL